MDISFKVARLAKNKGFDELCGTHYCYGSGDIKEPETGEVFIGGFLNNETGNPRFYRNSELVKWELPYGEFCCPSQAELQTWLREFYKVDVFVVKGDTYVETSDKYAYRIPTNQGGSWSSYYDTYEEALEKGFDFALQSNRIINKDIDE